MFKNFKRDCRRWHRIAAVCTALPMLVVILSGLLLQIKKQSTWVQPPTAKGTSPDAPPQVDWDRLLVSVKEVPEAKVESWSDIDRLDVRPNKGIVKLRCKNRWEIQCDLADGRVLSVNYRRSDLIESFHDGSFFTERAKRFVFLPNGLALLLLWASGLYLWWLPWGTRRKRKRK